MRPDHSGVMIDTKPYPASFTERWSDDKDGRTDNESDGDGRGVSQLRRRLVVSRDVRICGSPLEALRRETTERILIRWIADRAPRTPNKLLA